MSSNTAGGSFNLLYFASASSFTGKDSDEFQAPVPLSKLFGLIEAKYPGIKSRILDSCLVTVNLEYVDMPESETGETNITIKAGDEVAIIPPVSSG
jgi:molybdopterin converting factor small subunit